MKKILFLVKNIRDQRYGLLCLAAYLKEHGHIPDYCAIDTLDKLPLLFNKIKEFKPDILGVTAMTGEITFLIDIIERIKAVHSDLLCIVGGPHATFCPEIVENPAIDAICRGEGEEALVEFLDTYPNGDYHAVRNFGFFLQQKVVLNPLRPLITPDTLPIPDYDFIPRSTPDKLIAFATRNCIYNCTYCFNGEYRSMYRKDGEKKIYTIKSPDRFLQELKYLKDKYQFDYFYFHDDVFPTMKSWVAEFVARYPQEIGKPFHLGLNPALVDETFIAQMVKSGLISINMAIESGSPRIRELMQRPKMSNEQIIKLCRIIKKYDVYIDTQNIIMSPTETIEEAKQTLELNIAGGVDSAVIGKFQPYPGTRMAKMAEELGVVDGTTTIDRIPENYHWQSILNFPEEQAIQMDNLVHFFSFTVRFPIFKPLVYRLLKLRWDGFFHRLDDQYWMTFTRRTKKALIHKSWWRDLQTTLLFFYRLCFPKDKNKFTY